MPLFLRYWTSLRSITWTIVTEWAPQHHLGSGTVWGAVTWQARLPSLSCTCVPASSVVSGSLQSHVPQPARLLCLWDFPNKDTGVGCHFLFQGFFPTQGSNICLLLLLHCRQILYYWATREAHSKPNTEIRKFAAEKSFMSPPSKETGEEISEILPRREGARRFYGKRKQGGLRHGERGGKWLEIRKRWGNHSV